MAIGISQSTFSGWRDGLTDVPRRRTLWALHDLTNIPYRALVDAAIEDAGWYDEERARRAWLEWQAKRGEKLLTDDEDAALETRESTTS